MRKLMLAVLLLLVTAAFTTTRQNDSHMRDRHMMLLGSPMMRGDVEITASDTATGIAVLFTTKTGDVDELRRHVQRMSEIYITPGANGMMMGPNLVPGAAVYEAVPGGARVTLTPKDAAQVDEYRSQVQACVYMMKDGDPSGMQQMMKGMMAGSTAAPKSNK
jgi:hypothetical protein